MTELEKCQNGLMYDTAFPGREETHIRCADLCYDYNHTRPSDKAGREKLLRQIFGKLGENPYVEPTLFCGFGTNIEAGDNFFVNNNCVFVDPGKITFGNNVLIAPQCGFYTALHPLERETRVQGYEIARPITVGNDVWFGGGVKVLPGVTIGDNVVIGAGSVVTKDIPSNCLAFGNPCRVIRSLTPEERRSPEIQEHTEKTMEYGKKVWIFPDAELPPVGENPIPGHESIIITNVTDRDAHIRITLLFTDKEPVTDLSVTVDARRVRCLRTNEEKDFGIHTAKFEEQYAIMLESDVPVVAQYGRAEPRKVAFYTTPGYCE